VLFADVSGMTGIMEAGSPELVGRFLTELYQSTRTAVERARGQIIQFVQDNVSAVFLSPEPRAAVAAALEAAEVIHQSMAALASRFSLTIGVRIGIHAGEMLLGPVHDGETFKFMAFGETINVAARVEPLGQIAQTWSTDSILGLLPTGWTASDLRETE